MDTMRPAAPEGYIIHYTLIKSMVLLLGYTTVAVLTASAVAEACARGNLKHRWSTLVFRVMSVLWT